MSNQPVTPQRPNHLIKSKMNQFINTNKIYISKQHQLDQLKKISKIHNK